MNIETLAVYCGLIGTLAYWLYSIVIAPTRDKMDSIADSVKSMREILKDINDSLRESEKDRRELSEQIKQLQTETENLKDRLTRLESSWTKHLARCGEEHDE